MTPVCRHRAVAGGPGADAALAGFDVADPVVRPLFLRTEVPVLVGVEVAGLERADGDEQPDHRADEAGELRAEEVGGQPVRHRERGPREQRERQHLQRRLDRAFLAEEARHHGDADERQDDAHDDVVGGGPHRDVANPRRDARVGAVRDDRGLNTLDGAEDVDHPDDERRPDGPEGDRHEVARERDHDGRHRREAQPHQQWTDDGRGRPEAGGGLDERAHEEDEQHHLHAAVLAHGGEALIDRVERARPLQGVQQEYRAEDDV